MGSVPVTTMLSTPLLLILSCIHLTHAMSNYTVLVSGYNSQIARIRIYQTDSGTVMEKAGDWDVDKDMTWLQVEGDMVYAAHEVESYGGKAGGAISRWKMTEDGISRLETVILPTVSPAHLLVSLEMGLVFAANHGGHSFTAVRMDDGRLGDVSYHETFGAGCRDASHPHQTVAYGSWVWVVDLGCDAIWHYKVQNKEVVELGKTSVTSGMGPRHMVVHQQKKLVFLVGELQSLVEVYRMDVSDGSLEHVQSVELSPHPGDYGAEIVLGAGGEHVYATSRGSGVVLVYQIEQEDRLVKVQEFYLGGTWPRHFAIKEDIMVVADQKGDSVQLVNINKDTGMLSGGDMVQTGKQPAFVCFVD